MALVEGDGFYILDDILVLARDSRREDGADADQEFNAFCGWYAIECDGVGSPGF